MANGILYDSTLCIGCRACEQACAQRWNLSWNDAVGAEQQLSAHKLTTIQQHGDHFVRRMCMHCKEPTCVSVCPVAALRKTPEGPVVYDESRCMGCRYCMTACPFQVPVYEWSSTAPRVRKCDMCRARQLAGQATACAEACPTGATKFGEREALVAEAQQRIAEKPADYYPRVYGVHEAGGTSVLILSAVPFEQLGLRTGLPSEPLPRLTWNVLSHVPDVGTVGSVLLGGIWWITHRREEVARAEAKERQP
jgi:formate dehydrogenase iron-sulfur subunit